MRVVPNALPAEAGLFVGPYRALVAHRRKDADRHRERGGEYLVLEQRERGLPTPLPRCSSDAMNRSRSQVPGSRSCGQLLAPHRGIDGVRVADGRAAGLDDAAERVPGVEGDIDLGLGGRRAGPTRPRCPGAPASRGSGPSRRGWPGADGRRSSSGHAQCRKWRMPVKTMARPRSSAAAITSSSRIEPPGWMTAVAPASAAASRPSAKGKKASEATTEPRVSGSSAPQRCRGVGRLPGRDARGVDAAHLPGADADRRAVLGVDDGVRLDVLGDLEGEHQIGELALRSAGAW